MDDLRGLEFKSTYVMVSVERTPRRDQEGEFYYDLKIRRRLPDGNWRRNVNFKPEDIGPLQGLLNEAGRAIRQMRRDDAIMRAKTMAQRTEESNAEEGSEEE